MGAPLAAAHEGPHAHAGTSLRQWKLRDGNTKFEGSFVAANDGKLTLHLRDGQIIVLNTKILSDSDQRWLEKKQAAIAILNQSRLPVSSRSISDVSERAEDDPPGIANHFQPFVKDKSIKTRWDDRYFYIESNGIPDHEMMVGITAWQQQVPIPHNYTGENAWRIPLKPVPADQPMSAKTNFFRGAIALAVNGVPIFNPIKNDGRTDTNLAGELDEFGGHCGRADDYHYHLPPVHLEKVVGQGMPIAYALDGYPILGFQSNQEARKSKLDWLNGHQDEHGHYHYHATLTYPYLNGGFYGQVTERNGQVDPQPRAQGVRPASRPLRGATITRFQRSEDGKQVVVGYQLRGEQRSVRYTTEDFQNYQFTFDNGQQGKATETYSQPPPRGGRGGRGDRRGREDPGRQPPGRDPPPRRKGQQGNRGGGQDPQPGGPNKAGSRLGGYQTPPPANNVPDHDFDILLGRPTDHSVTLSVLVYGSADGVVFYGTNADELSQKTEPFKVERGEPFELEIDDLQRDTTYWYQLNYRFDGKSEIGKSKIYSFQTQRSPNSSFRFTVQADSHLDENTSGEVYLATLRNALRDGSDFHVALGDTFMTGKYVRPELAEPQYLAQRYYFGSLCHSTPLFFCLGNHDGESSKGRRGGGREKTNQPSDAEATRIWSVNARKKYFPNPFPDKRSKNSFYSGNQTDVPNVGQIEDYYAWQWGNSLFIVLDPFWYSTGRSKTEGDHWHQTLGNDQYQWLVKTLAESKAQFKFVFIHHLVGGADRNNRGGIASAPFFEWGGKELDGTKTFAKHRPNWKLPIHDLLVQHDVSIVFHGHDHLYAKEEMDGIIYQAVPQPGHPRFGNVRSAEEYGYHGEVISSSGHLRISVSSDSARVDYVRAYLPKDESSRRINGEISASYIVK